MAELGAKKFHEALKIAFSRLGIRRDAVIKDELHSAGGCAIAAHILERGKQDKALLVTIAHREMIDTLRKGKQRREILCDPQGGQDGAPTIWDGVEQTRLIAPRPRRKLSRKLVVQVDKRFRESDFLNGRNWAKGEQPSAIERDIAELWLKKDMNPDEIGRALGISRAVVSKHIQGWKAEMRQDESRDMDGRIVDLAQQGLNQDQIADELGISQVAVSKRIKQIKAREREWKLSNPIDRLSGEGTQQSSAPG